MVQLHQLRQQPHCRYALYIMKLELLTEAWHLILEVSATVEQFCNEKLILLLCS